LKRITWLSSEHGATWFPPLESVLDEPPGLLAAGGALSIERLRAAYRRGIFPWYSPGQPVLWWCPEPRMVLFPHEFRRSRSLVKSERNRGFRVSFDTAFSAVVAACAAPRESAAGTWITGEMQAAYEGLHAAGDAHSVEVWRDNALLGGLYGVQLGRVFYGESMFSCERDASKVALSALVRRCLTQEIALIDCQLETEHLGSLGSRAIPRAEFLALLEQHAAPQIPSHWQGPDLP